MKKTICYLLIACTIASCSPRVTVPVKPMTQAERDQYVKIKKEDKKSTGTIVTTLVCFGLFLVLVHEDIYSGHK